MAWIQLLVRIALMGFSWGLRVVVWALNPCMMSIVPSDDCKVMTKWRRVLAVGSVCVDDLIWIVVIHGSGKCRNLNPKPLTPNPKTEPKTPTNTKLKPALLPQRLRGCHTVRGLRRRGRDDRCQNRWPKAEGRGQRKMAAKCKGKYNGNVWGIAVEGGHLASTAQS